MSFDVKEYIKRLDKNNKYLNDFVPNKLLKEVIQDILRSGLDIQTQAELMKNHFVRASKFEIHLPCPLSKIEIFCLYNLLDPNKSEEKKLNELNNFFNRIQANKIEIKPLPEIKYPKTVKSKQQRYVEAKFNLNELSELIIQHAKQKNKFKQFKKNTWHFKKFESDLLGFTDKNKIHEFEIKTSYSDFKNDFKKACCSTKQNKHALIQQGKLSDYFWFVVPSHLYKNRIEPIVPNYCGVLCYIVNHKNEILFVEEVKEAKKLK